VIDESSNIASYRIINTLVITNNGDCFYISNVEAQPRKLRAQEISKEAINTVTRITHGDLLKWASWTIDTCATMRASWKKLENILSIAHVFIASYDSHALQLVIKDLL
jgi:hypothetical protein